MVRRSAAAAQRAALRGLPSSHRARKCIRARPLPHSPGKDGVRFYTQTKTVTSSWKYQPAAAKVSMSMPTLG